MLVVANKEAPLTATVLLLVFMKADSKAAAAAAEAVEVVADIDELVFFGDEDEVLVFLGVEVGEINVIKLLHRVSVQ
jgi:hypothetical protein